MFVYLSIIAYKNNTVTVIEPSKYCTLIFRNKSQENHVSPFFNGQTYISNYRVASLLKKIVGVETNFKKIL